MYFFIVLRDRPVARAKPLMVAPACQRLIISVTSTRETSSYAIAAPYYFDLRQW
jgi:hypothetical protein